MGRIPCCLMALLVCALRSGAALPLDSLRAATAADRLVCLYDERGLSLRIHAGDSLTAFVQDQGTGHIEQATAVVQDSTTLGFIIAQLQKALERLDGGIALQLESDGTFQVDLSASTTGVAELGIVSNRAESYPCVAGTTWISNLRAGDGGKNSLPLRAPVSATSACVHDSVASVGSGTVLYSRRFLAAGRDMNGAVDCTPLLVTPLTCLFDEDGNSLDIRLGDTITIHAENGSSGAPVEFSFAVGAAHDVAYLRDRINNDVLGVIDGAAAMTVNADGSTTVNTGAVTETIANSSVTDSRTAPGSYLENLLSFGPSMTPPGGPYNSTGSFRRPADALDELNDLYGSSGAPAVEKLLRSQWRYANV